MQRKLLLLLMLCVFISMFAGCNRTNTDEIVIGGIMPISGQISTYGTQSKDAIEMAVEEINKKGGILGKKLKVIVEDDEDNPEKTVNAFTKLVTQEKVVGIVGALTSKCSLAINQEAQKRKVILITPTSTNDTVTEAGDFVFRACYNDSFQGQVVAKFVNETLKAKKAAIIFDNSNDYSRGLKENFKNKFEELGGKVLIEESYATNDKDFKAQLTKIKGKNPEVLFIPDYYSTVSLIAKQVRALGITIPMLGADGWDEIINNAGDEVTGCYYCNHYSPEADDKEVKDFIKNYKSKYNIVPNALAALAYDATYILAEAIEKAGVAEPEKIKMALMETNKKYVTGQITFNEQRNPVKSAVMLKIVKGTTKNKPQVVYAGTVNP